jgi:hypothetical protein
VLVGSCSVGCCTFGCCSFGSWLGGYLCRMFQVGLDHCKHRLACNRSCKMTQCLVDNDPPRHMRNFIDDPSTELYHSTSLPVDQGIATGMQFHSKNDCVFAIRLYHIRQSLDYSVKQSDHERYVIKCKNENCGFKLRASLRKKNERWEIGKMKHPHSCVSTDLTQDHRKLSANVICESVKSLLHTDTSMRVKVIIAHIQEKFNYTISYRKT